MHTRSRYTKGEWIFHKGLDYAVVMTAQQTTDNAFCRLYGEDRDVTARGNAIVAIPKLIDALSNMVERMERTGREQNNLDKLLTDKAREALKMAGVEQVPA